jgi:hypothetical protein
MMYLRDVVLNLLHLNHRPALRSTRHFSANTHDLISLFVRIVIKA